jgi:hypothetical protein
MDGGVEEIGQAAAMIKVHMGKNDVPHILWAVSETGYLAQRALFWVQGDFRDDLEDADYQRLVDIVVCARAGIHKQKPIVGFDQ